LKKVKSLWEDPNIREIWETSKNWQVQVSQLDYLMENIDEYIKNDFTPTDEDILRSRQRTSGSHTTRFVINRYIWEIVDVGGQLPERAKWGKVIASGVHCIIYFASLDEYNMESTEEIGKTKMEISMEVFKQVVLDDDTADICIILFLNKQDLFKQKLMTKKGAQEFHDKFVDFKSFLDSGYQEEFDSETEKREIESLSKNEKLYRAALKYLENTFRKSIVTSEVPEIKEEQEKNLKL